MRFAVRDVRDRAGAVDTALANAITNPVGNATARAPRTSKPDRHKPSLGWNVEPAVSHRRPSPGRPGAWPVGRLPTVCRILKVPDCCHWR